MNEERLEEIRRRAEAATEGPWRIEESRYEGSYNVTSVNETHDLSACLCRPDDAEFISHAREDIPDLLAEVERLRSELSAIQAITGCHRTWRHIDSVLGEATKNDG